MVTSATTIPAPTIEPLLIDSSSITIRIFRVPTTLVPDTTGGYFIYRSTKRDGFLGASGTDFLLMATATQPTAVNLFRDKNLPTDPAGVTLYYRAVAVDSVASATKQSPPSNVIVWQQLSDRRVPIPAWPVDLCPNQGVLKGVILRFEDENADAGVTWHEVRTAMVAAQQMIADELLQTMSENQLHDMLRSPPPAYRNWFENLAASLLIDRASLQPEELEARREQYEKRASHWREELYDDNGAFLIPGGGSGATGGLRVVR